MIANLKISVLIPVYNEKETVLKIVEEVKNQGVDEIILVDDCSTDGTTDIIRTIGDTRVKQAFHERNMGKGAGVRTGLSMATGDVVVIQDADLEYDPAEYSKLIDPISKGRADIVYGSRFKGITRVFYFWHYVGNKFLTLVANLLYNTTLSDMETCYKVFKKGCVTDLNLRSDGWGFDPEITAHFLKKKYRIIEVPISYFGRTYEEGKKIRWKHGFTVLFTLLRCRFS